MADQGGDNAGGNNGNGNNNGNRNSQRTTPFKMPWAWDNNAPKFETESADDLMKFVDHANQIFALAGITTDVDRKKRLTDYLSVSKKELWRAMKSYTDGSTYDKFVEDIYKIYPEVKSTKVGSLEALDRLCRQYKGIRVYDEGLLKRFSLEYGTLVKKLLAGKAIITNAEACRRYLETLDSSFSTTLNMTISSQNILKRQMASNNPALVPLVAIADGRKEDPIEIANLIDMAEAMAEGQQGSEALTHGVGSTSHLRDFSVMKKERSEELEDIAGSVAYLKDVVMLMQKDSQSVQSEMMKTLQQVLRNPPPVRERDEPPHKEQSKPSSMPSRPSQDDYYTMTRDRTDNSQECYYCDGTGHYARGCPVKEEHIMKGWISVESGKLKLGDGNWIPKGDGPRKDRVEAYWRNKSVSQNWYSREEIPAPGERPIDVLETAMDEIRTLKVKLAQAKEVNTYQRVEQNPVHPTFTASVAQNVQPQTQPPVNDLANALQALLLRGLTASNGDNMADQFAYTRANAKQGGSNSNF
jgi:hypothetical protein